MGAKSFLKSGEYYLNVYETGQTGDVHISREQAKAVSGNQAHKRIRLKVTNLGDTLDIFNTEGRLAYVDQIH